ncbi:DUF6233 domain-containing protein [Streptomyces paradoxus]|uniref:DUF6233 domain-containing protein n=1 Tax=Streptomyces paradoxus TaxID=66375 RepID=UPI00362A6F24
MAITASQGPRRCRLACIDNKIADLQRREAQRENGRRVRPARPERLVQLGIGTGRPPVQVHVGDCYTAGNRRRAIDRDEARRLLASGLPACPHSPGALAGDPFPRAVLRVSLVDLESNLAAAGRDGSGPFLLPGARSPSAARG